MIGDGLVGQRQAPGITGLDVDGCRHGAGLCVVDRLGHLVDTLKELGVPDDTIGEIGGALAPLQSQTRIRE